MPPGTFSSLKGLGCLLSPSLDRYEAQWILPNQMIISDTKGRFGFLFFRNANIFLNISKVSYADEGVYVCRFRELSDMAPWVSNTTELLLPGIFLHVCTTGITRVDFCSEFELSEQYSYGNG